jgi:sortase A
MMMSRKLGLWMMLFGILMLLGSGAWLLYNDYEDKQAGSAAESQLSVLVQQIQEQQTEVQASAKETEPTVTPTETLWIPEELPTEGEVTEPTMPAMEIEGESYIGYLSMPTIQIELPILSDWNYDKLLRAPCYYYGTVEKGNLALMAHNYTRHFGKLSLLKKGDRISFVDIHGATTEYEVLFRETLPPKCIPQLIEGSYDLTLFTCTYSGANRIVVRCDQITE